MSVKSRAAPSPLMRRLAGAGILLAVVLAGAGVFWAADRGGEAGPSIGGPFTLVDGDGRTVTNRSFPGKYMLVYFGYTFCPDVCPTTLTEVADAMDQLGPKSARVQPIFITVDPKRDTPAVVKQYAAQFSPRLIGLTGSTEAVAEAAKNFKVYYAQHQTGSGPDDYAMDHSSILYLVGPDGRFLAPIPASESGAEMASQMEKLIS